MRSRSAVALALAFAVTACGGDPDPGPGETPDDGGPYVVVAVDYHFHDAHPSKPIAGDLVVEISNQTSNVHNVTFLGLDFDRNVRPGKRLRIAPISDVLPEPGRYPFVCKFHRDRGMTGVLVIVA
ncbi:MAG: cupredoxin domain-containing protein [Actinomycetota bacterium]